MVLVLWGAVRLGDRLAVQGASAQVKIKPNRTPDCVYVPTPYDVVEKMLQMANVKKTDVIYDLGCGDGRIIVQAAKKRGCRAVGYEIEPNRIREAYENIKKNKVEHLVEIRQEDLFTADFSEATVMGLYLLPGMMTKLLPKIEKLPPGTRIVAHDYGFHGIQPDKVVTVTSNETNVQHTLYLYTLPLKRQKQPESE